MRDDDDLRMTISMIRATILTLVVAAVLAAPVHAQSNVSADVTLQKAIAVDTIQGDARRAIPLYEQAFKEAGANRMLAARALIGLARAQEKDGRPEARLTYEHVVRDYPDSGEPFTVAQSRLAALPGGRGAAASSPADRSPFEMLDMSFVPDYVSRSGMSPNGRMAAYPNNTYTQILLHLFPAGPDRVLADLGGSRLRGALAWAPDSQSLAFHTHDAETNRADVRVVSIATGTLRTLMSWDDPTRTPAIAEGLSWSPDSQSVAFSRAGEVRLAALRGGEPRLLDSTEVKALNQGPNRFFLWSPDGHRLAFPLLQASEAVSGVRVIDINTFAAFTLPTADVGRVELVKWTSSDEICYRKGSSVFLAPVSGGDVRTVSWSAGDTWIDVTPDAAWLVLQKGDTKRLVLHRVADGSERPATTGPGQELHATLSPDGRLISFASNRDGKWGFYVAAIDRAPEAHPLRLSMLSGVPTDRADGQAEWSNETGTLSKGFTYIEQNVYRLPMDPTSGRAAGDPQRLTVSWPTNTRPAVSPDGRRIAFVHTTGPSSGIDIVDASGTHERVLVDAHRDTKLRWRSPEQLLFNEGAGTRAGLGPQFVMFDVKTGVQQALTLPMDTSSQGLVDWTYVPGRDEILYVTRPASIPATGPYVFRLYAVRDGSDRIVTTRDHADFFPGASSLAIDLEGRRVAYLSGGTIHIVDLADAGKDVAVGSNINPTALSWAPDGSHLAYCRPNGRCEALNVESGQSSPLLMSPGTNPNVRWFDASWDPNGSFLALTGVSNRSEWHAFSGVTYEAITKLISASAR
jgi:Tol biopolymer transport system component